VGWVSGLATAGTRCGIQIVLETIAGDVQQSSLGLALVAVAHTAVFDAVRASAHDGGDQQKHAQSDGGVHR